MKGILFHTAKIVIAAGVSICLADAVELDFPVSAGIMSILTIQPTKKETLKTAFGRFLAFLTALFIANLCFGVLGYTMTAYLAYLAFYIFICQTAKWYSAMAMNSVLISHFLTFGNMGTDAVWNEARLFFIGVGIGIAVNLHLKKNVDYIEELKESADNQIREILRRMAERVVKTDVSDYGETCFPELRNSIRRAKNVAEENYNNQFKSDDTYDRDYIRMRDKQCQALYQMYKSIRTMETTPVTAEKISGFLLLVAESYHKNNTAKELLIQFHELDEQMKSHPLPVKRKEFEDRAKLYHLLRNMEEFLMLKAVFSDKYLQ